MASKRKANKVQRPEDRATFFQEARQERYDWAVSVRPRKVKEFERYAESRRAA